MRKQFLFAASAILLLASCSNNNDTSEVVVKNLNELGVSVKVASITRSEKAAFASTDAVGVFIDGLTAGAYTSKLATYTYDGTLWNAPSASANKIYLSGDQAYVYGYYPSTAVVDMGSKSMTCTIPVTQSFSATEATDYMYSTSSDPTKLPVVSDQSVSSSSAALYFHHALSKVSFVINKDQTYPVGTVSGVVTNIKLSSTSSIFSTAGSINLANGSLTSTATASTLTLTGSANCNEYSATPVPPINATRTAFGLFAPCSGDLSTITATFTIDGTPMEKALTTVNVQEWKQGNEYIYVVTVLPRELQITCQIVPWVVSVENLGTIQ